MYVLVSNKYVFKDNHLENIVRCREITKIQKELQLFHCRSTAGSLSRFAVFRVDCKTSKHQLTFNLQATSFK